MKLHKYIYLQAVALTIGAAATLTSCNDEPEPVPAQETYLRNFIMEYGLIDPEQDWNMATTTSLTLVSDGIPRDVNVLVDCGGTLRRVGEYKDVKRDIQVDNLDVPSFAKALYVESNGEMIEADLKESASQDKLVTTVNLSYLSSTPSNVQRNYEDMAWLIAAEDLGSTDDMDFNDIVLRIESVSVNYKGGIGTSDWQVMGDQDDWADMTYKNKGSKAASRDGETIDKLTSKRIRVTALAAGGTLPLWLHYRLESNNYDYIIGYNGDGGSMKSTDSFADVTAAKSLEWHRWFGYDRDDIMINTGTPTQNTNFDKGEHAALGSVVIYVSDKFTMETFSFVDYYEEEDGKNKEDWEWSVDDYSKYNIQGFYITVGGYRIEDCNAVLAAAHKGAAPQMFLIPDAGAGSDALWHWPTERTNIKTVYPGFTDWVGNVTQTDWFATYASDAQKNVHYMRK